MTTTVVSYLIECGLPFSSIEDLFTRDPWVRRIRWNRWAVVR